MRKAYKILDATLHENIQLGRCRYDG